MGKEDLTTTFVEASAEERVQEREKLLQMKISELGLKLEGTRLEALVDELYKELDAAGILLKPRVYLTDEWGCPERVMAAARQGFDYADLIEKIIGLALKRTGMLTV